MSTEPQETPDPRAPMSYRQYEERVKSWLEGRWTNRKCPSCGRDDMWTLNEPIRATIIPAKESKFYAYAGFTCENCSHTHFFDMSTMDFSHEDILSLKARFRLQEDEEEPVIEITNERESGTQDSSAEE